MSNEPVQNRISYADIAKRVGYHRTTIGLALRNHPSIPDCTRDEILRVAQEMGYRPDPALSSLSTYRHKKQSVHRDFTTIALISDVAIDSRWKKERHAIRDYYRGILERADELGYSVEEFSVGMDEKGELLTNRMLRTRGIRAVIVCPLRYPRVLNKIEWKYYSAVCIGYTLPDPKLMRISSQHRAGAMDAVNGLYQSGYRKIGLVLERNLDSRADFAWSGGFYCACHNPERADLKYAVYTLGDTFPFWGDELVSWIREEGVDVVLSANYELHDFLKQQGFRIPEDLGFASLDLPAGRPELSGIDQLSMEIGRQAVDQISGLYLNHTFGLLKNRMVHAIQGKWVASHSSRKG